MAALLASLLAGLSLPRAQAVNYTITYLANETQFQQGSTSGTTPGSISAAAGNYTVASNSGNLARQGFTFAGWNTLANGTGTTYLAGAGTLTLSGNLSLYAKWEIPASARLIGNSGTLKTISNTGITNGSYCNGGMRGLTSDGTYVYFRSGATGGGGYLCKATMAGALQYVYNVGSLLSEIPTDSIALTYANGCIYARLNGTANTSIKCIDITNSSSASVSTINLPAGKPLFAGNFWLEGNLITFPDGRIGSVSQPKQSLATGTGAGQCPSGLYCKVLRLFNVTGSGASSALTFSEDIILADNSSAGWPTDDHGIATDGTFLYQINFSSGYKVYALASGSPSYLVFNGVDGSTCNSTSPAYCAINTPNTGLSTSNATFLSRNHYSGQYLMGDYSAAKFWVSDAATPPPGPGNPVSTISAPAISGTLYKGVLSTISITSNLAGIVRFFVGGKRISTCKDRSTSGSYPNYTVTCSWKPPITGKQVVSATLTPTSNLFSAVTNMATFWVVKRSTSR